ncbi:pvl orF-50-like family [Caudoviricetes sp.]|nr:pvl orF-50-like family [Caudoviricetes sp.]
MSRTCPQCGGLKANTYATVCAACKGLCFHGLSRTAEYAVWKTMVRRCVVPGSQNYASYGGRGITVCARWRVSVENFLEDMGKRPSPKHSIDRRDNEGGYWCGHCTECITLGRSANCRWATLVEQCRNRRSNHLVEYQGEQRAVAELATTFGLHPQTLGDRLRSGWPIEQALLTKARPMSPPGGQHLTEDDVREIRKRRASGEELRSIANDYGIKFQLVSRIARQECFKHVA